MNLENLPGVVLLGIVLPLALGCSSDDKSSGGGDVQTACDIIVNQCGGEANGFHMDECLEGMGQNSSACAACVVREKCNYESACHDPSNNCELK